MMLGVLLVGGACCSHNFAPNLNQTRHDNGHTHQMVYIVQSYGPHGDYTQATVVKSFATALEAWDYYDWFYTTIDHHSVPRDCLTLVVVDEQRRPVPRPAASLY